MRNLKRALSLALSTVMLLGMMVVGTSASYADVDAQDNLEAIEVLQMTGIMTGDENGNFNPDKNVTRNEMAVIMCNLLDLNKGGSNPFNDVPDWADPYVSACYANGIIAGVSATQFNGNANVTTAQAALMVMKALGYFGYQGEFGDNWTVATIKQGTKIDLFDGIDAGATAALSRSEVAQLVLNALETKLVVVTEEGGMEVDGNGISVSVKPTYDYAYAVKRDGINYNNSKKDSSSEIYQELTEKLFGNKLKKTTTSEDAFGRPATKWTYGTDSITAPEGADLTYTAEVKGKAIYADLGKVDPDKVVYWEDGRQVDAEKVSVMPSGFDIASGNEKKVGGNGTLVEVYYNDEEADTVATVVVINTYVAEVVDCEENDDDKYDISVDGESEKFESEVAFEDEDVVLYTKTLTAGGATDEIKSMALAEKITGEVTRVKDKDSFVLDGTTYKYNKNFEGNKLDSTAVDFDTDAYLDAYGYVVKLDNTDATTNYAVVVGTSDGAWDENDVISQVKLLLPDGTVSVVDVDTVKGLAEDAKLVKNTIVTYTVNSDDEYTLTVRSDAMALSTGALKVEQGKATVTVNGVAKTATSKTEFFLYNSADKEYTTYTGIKNVSDLASSKGDYQVAYVADGTVLKAVYVYAGVDVTDNTSDSATFIYVKGDEKEIKDTDLGNYYTFKAVVDGEITEINVSSKLVGAKDATFLVDGKTNHNGYIVSKIKTNADGIVTAATVEGTDLVGSDLTLTNGDGYIVDSAASVKKAEDDVITIAGVGLAYADDVDVFEYNTADSKFVSKTIGSLKTTGEGESYNIFVQIDDSIVIGVYYIK